MEKPDCFEKWCSVTTAHGFPDYNRSKHWREKTIWTLLLFVSLSALTANLFQVLGTFFDADSRWGTSIYERGESKLPSIHRKILENEIKKDLRK